MRTFLEIAKWMLWDYPTWYITRLRVERALWAFLGWFFRDALIWLFWDFSGLRAIWERIRPPYDLSTHRRRPATFMLWVIGIYSALFGIASQRYENRIDIVHSSTLSVADGAFAAKIAGRPHIWHIHGKSVGTTNAYGSYLRVESLYALVNALSTKIIAVSEAGLAKVRFILVQVLAVRAGIFIVSRGLATRAESSDRKSVV